ncbi:MAG: PAS domain S-box protein [Deltaproteobacteria bacterium]|nr:PAS domain S-box protein [Deltaproteobacteria bacterium]MBI3294557.1 PAS domain S-box protein [Deltaproteobacteria bacterium]
MTQVERFGLDNPEVFLLCAQASNEAIMLTDTTGHIRYVNRAFTEIYLFTAEEVIGQTPRILRSGFHTRDFYTKMWSDILDPKKRMWRGEVTNRAKDGNDVSVLLSISPYEKDGQVHGYMSIALDVRENKRMEAQLLHQDRLASIGLLASGLAHEIGTPLGVIRGRAEYLMMRAREEDQKGLDTIITQIDRISKLIYALLHVARAGKSETVVAVALAPVLNEVGTLVSQLLRQSTIRFVNEVPAHAMVMADSDRVQQLFLNLIMNSIHAIESVRKAGVTTERGIFIKGSRSGGLWTLSIRDEGCGISSENLKKVFKPFFTTKDVGKGTGLGLVTCQNIVGSWGGDLTLKSVEGEGTEVLIRIPSA